MLTVGKEYFREQINPNADIRLLGQELNAQTYAICKSDMLITGEDTRQYSTRFQSHPRINFKDNVSII